jgi:methyl-accepting chemotaxis protein
MFQDQSQLYQRQIEQLTAVVQSSLRQVGNEVDRLSKASADITLDSHRLSANIQQAARTISEAADRLAGSPRP